MGGVKIIDYKGVKYNTNKFKAISESDILVFPTSYNNECFPLVLLEAMQQGTPTISTPIGGIEDIVIDGETGLIAMENSPEDLASKIINCLDNPELKIKLGKNAYNHFKQNYTLDKFEHNLCEIFNSVCTKNGDI